MWPGPAVSRCYRFPLIRTKTDNTDRLDLLAVLRLLHLTISKYILAQKAHRRLTTRAGWNTSDSMGRPNITNFLEVTLRVIGSEAPRWRFRGRKSSTEKTMSASVLQAIRPFQHARIARVLPLRLRTSP